jgi:glycosyltransferase involved in cell wall biosynthesis
LANTDLTIVTQENKLLYNHLMLMLPRRGKLAFWGHGANLQSTRPHGMLERYKRWTTTRVDWWFAYTEMSADLVKRTRFPDDRVTILNNAVDTTALRQQVDSITPEETSALLQSLGLTAAPTAIYIGSLYADKRLDFLTQAAEQIRRRVPGFQLIIVGDGPERSFIERWCGYYPWARWVGVKFGRDKALHMSAAQLMLNPGLVGLGILDSFAGRIPMVTTHSGNHSPEISYLQHGVNGLVLPYDVGNYVDACVKLFTEPASLAALRKACDESAAVYTVDNMAKNFADGIAHCLAMPRHRRGVSR